MTDRRTVQPLPSSPYVGANGEFFPITAAKHQHDCDCGICQYCNGDEDVYGRKTDWRALHTETSAKYAELILAVAHKYPNESRHETALRYIQQAERHGDATAIAGKLMDMPHENPCQGECKICEYAKEMR